MKGIIQLRSKSIFPKLIINNQNTNVNINKNPALVFTTLSSLKNKDFDDFIDKKFNFKIPYHSKIDVMKLGTSKIIVKNIINKEKIEVENTNVNLDIDAFNQIEKFDILSSNIIDEMGNVNNLKSDKDNNIKKEKEKLDEKEKI